MEDVVEYCGEDMTYRDYLMRHQSTVISTDVDKFRDVQDSIAEYFLGTKSGVSIPPTSRLARLAPRKIPGGSEVDNFKCSLSMLETLHCMISMGYCSTSYRLMQSSVIAAAALISHRTAFTGSDARGSGGLQGEEDGAGTGEEEGDGEDRSSKGQSDFGASSSGDDMSVGGLDAVYADTVNEEAVRRDSSGRPDQYLPLTQEYLPGKKGVSLRHSSPATPSSRKRLESNPMDSESAPERETMLERRSELPDAILKKKAVRRGLEFTRICERHDSIQHPDVVIEHVYENQRYERM
jgi:hypothetical protein